MPDETPSIQVATNGVAPQSAAPAQPQTVTIPLEQLQTFTSIQSRLAQLEAEKAQQARAAQEEQARLAARNGEVENALRILREQSDQQVAAERARLVATEERAKRYALDGELARVLGAQPLVPGGTEQLNRLWRNEFQVEIQGDSFTVRTPTFQSVNEFVAAQLAKPEYAHFIRASSQGGTAGSTGAHQAAPTTPAHPAVPPQPKTLGEAVIIHMQQIRSKAEVDPRLDLSTSFGLRPVSRN